MSDNKQENDNRETVADILAEMRGMGNYQRYSGDHAHALADRIESAWKRESKAIATENAVLPAVCITKPSGNAAAMREAMELASCVSDLCCSVEYDPLEECHRYCCSYQDVQGQERVAGNKCPWKKIRAALSAPPRNCDVGTAEEQERRFDAFVTDRRGDLNCTGKCPAHNGVDFGVVDCVLQWAQMPYDFYEKGKCDEQK